MKKPKLIKLYEAGMLPANKIANLSRRVERAKIHTCPASRHLHMMADALLKDGSYYMFEEDPRHCAGTMLSVLESLWKARNELEKHRRAMPVKQAWS